MWNIRNWEVSQFKKEPWRSVSKGETPGRDQEPRGGGRALSQLCLIHLSWLMLSIVETLDLSQVLVIFWTCWLPKDQTAFL